MTSNSINTTISIKNNNTMNTIFKYSMMFAAALTLAMGATSCSDDNNDDHVGTFGTNELKEVNADYVDNTIVATYRNLANYNKVLMTDINAMTDDAGVAKACDTWRLSRKWWEFSRHSFSALPATITLTRIPIPGRSTRPSLRTI